MFLIRAFFFFIFLEKEVRMSKSMPKFTAFLFMACFSAFFLVLLAYAEDSKGSLARSAGPVNPTLTPTSADSSASIISIIPQPVSIEAREGSFRLKPDTLIIAAKDKASLSTARKLSDMLRPATGFVFEVRTGAARNNSIFVEQDSTLRRLGDEGYSLEVTPSRIEIRAPGEAGIFYAFQTLRQLLPPQIFRQAAVDGVKWTVPCVRIEDYPRFWWRGAMLDSCRYFMPKEFIKKFIDLLALHKMNSFHWHLTEDQGWRIEIKKYPRLTEIGSWRKESILGHYSNRPRLYDNTGHGGYYTQDDIREIVEYAGQRYIRIVPEIEMPGHAQAAIAAYPELGNTGEELPVSTEWGVHRHVYNVKEETILFLQDVLSEVMELFPGQFIHIGGDEVPKDEWKENPEAQVRIKELGLKDENELQSYFIQRIDQFLTSKGRRLIGWDEIIEGGLAPGAAVMSWRGESGGITAAKANHDVVMAPTSYTYFDYYQSRDVFNEPLAIGGYLPLETVYNYEPIPAALGEEEARHILGAQAQLWTEYIPNAKKAEYMGFPRITALAEVVWTQKEKKDYSQFIERLTIHLKRLNILDVNYRPLPLEPLPAGQYNQNSSQ